MKYQIQHNTNSIGQIYSFAQMTLDDICVHILTKQLSGHFSLFSSQPHAWPSFMFLPHIPPQSLFANITWLKGHLHCEVFFWNQGKILLDYLNTYVISLYRKSLCD